MNVAVYPGSFDPVTYGHLNIVERGLKIFDKIVIAVAVNINKKTTFTYDERQRILNDLFAGRPEVEVDAFEGLLVDYAVRRQVTAVLRGIRTISDWENEFQMALTNRCLNDQVETVFMMTEGKYSHISSSNIKEIVKLGGSAVGMVPPEVEQALRDKLK